MLWFNHALETCFGQTEVPQIAVCMRTGEWQDPQNPASSGRTTVLTQIGIMDGAGQFLGPGEMGEIVLAGDLLMAGCIQAILVTSIRVARCSSKTVFAMWW